MTEHEPVCFFCGEARTLYRAVIELPGATHAANALVCERCGRDPVVLSIDDVPAAKRRESETEPICVPDPVLFLDQIEDDTISTIRPSGPYAGGYAFRARNRRFELLDKDDDGRIDFIFSYGRGPKWTVEHDTLPRSAIELVEEEYGEEPFLIPDRFKNDHTDPRAAPEEPEATSDEPLDDERTCPKCGLEVLLVTVVGPGEAYASPCGCKINPLALHRRER